MSPAINRKNALEAMMFARGKHAAQRPAVNQLDMFEPLLQAYAEADGSMSNADLYERISEFKGLSKAHWDHRVPIGQKGELHSPERRRYRWYQQSLKELGLIEQVEGARGRWRATPKLRESRKKDQDLTPALPNMVMLGFSTKLGISLWANANDVFTRLNEPIHLCLTSPPYPLARARAYGGPKLEEYVDFVCRLMDPIVKNLVPGGSIALNISNDIFVPGTPARSLYREELLLTLCKRFGLYKMDEIIWHDPSKAPGPIAWASKNRFQLNVAWEPVYWLTNDPMKVRSDNRRVLRPHTEAQRKLIERGGESRSGSYGDGANRMRPGAFGAATAGSIPRNILPVPHRCPSQIGLRRELARRGLSMHGATFPLELAAFFVKFLTEEGDLVVDPCDGWGTTSLAAEQNGRRWVATERMPGYTVKTVSNCQMHEVNVLDILPLEAGVAIEEELLQGTEQEEGSSFLEGLLNLSLKRLQTNGENSIQFWIASNQAV